MHARLIAIAAMAVLVFGACGGGGGGGAATPGGGGAATFNANAVTGTVQLFGWKASDEEEAALKKTLEGFAAKYPNIKVDYQTTAEYPTQMLAKFSAGAPPDLFYVDSAVAPEWIKQGVLQDLDSLAQQRSFDLNQFYEGYLNAFKGPDGKTYGFPKDGNTLGMAYNTEMLEAAGVQPPKTMDELNAALPKLKQPAMCLNHSLDRALAFIYANGGALFTDDKKAAAIDRPESKAAVAKYIDYFKSGQGKRASDLGVDWCGQALGEKKVALIFEGGWLDPYMRTTFKDVKYGWAPFPDGPGGDVTLGFTASYSIGTQSKNKDQAWVLLSYLAGPEGMKTWTEGGVANPSRKDVQPAAGKEVLVQQASSAKPWSFIPGFSKVDDAFKNSMTAAIEGSGTADQVVAATKKAIDEAVAQ
jgi:multiple sugar transport system substrate-binding protein